MSQNSQRVYQQIRLLDPLSSTDIITDVLIIDNKIEAIESKISSISEKIEVIDGEGLILAPGLVDLYSHSAEPGYEERETFVSLTEAAMAGGFTRIAILPNTVPVIDNPATLALLQSKINSPKLQFYFWGSLTQNLEGKKISELADLVNSGVIGFTDNKSHGNLNLIRRLLEYAQPFNLPIGLIPCDLQLRGNGVVREGDMSIKLGLLGDPTLSETVAIASIIELVAETKTPVHLMRISTARGVELIKQAKERDLPITASCTWMHLLFNTEAIASYDSNYRLEPPLGSENDRLALIEGIKEGVIDAIAIDHTAYTYEEKTVGFQESPPGVIGLELALPLLWQNLVEKNLLSPLNLWRALSINPLICLNQKQIDISTGKSTELILFDPHKTWNCNKKNIKSLSKNTPFWDQLIKGKILKTHI